MEQAIAVANYFIQKSLESDNPSEKLTNMKLLKLVYIAHGWYLGMFGKPLLSESPEAWKHGPVIPSVYNQFRNNKSNVILKVASGWPWMDQSIFTLKHEEELRPFLDKVWEEYKDYSGFQLSSLTHQQGTPWDVAWNQLGGKDRLGAPIPQELIKGHYQQKMLENKKFEANA